MVRKWKWELYLNSIEKLAIEKLKNELLKIDGVVKVILFGSKVRGDFPRKSSIKSGESDIDILIIIKDLSYKDAVIKCVSKIELEHDIVLSPVIYTLKEYETNLKLKSPFFERIENEGISLL